MLFDAGTLTLCTLQNTSSPGEMPEMKLQKQSTRFYGERTVGYARQYAAFGVNQQIDLLLRIWQDRSAQIGMYALLEDGSQYRVDNVQHLVDDSGLKVTDLTLSKLEKYYDVAAET